jgi:4-aminobutyrate aminotransferase-like enzyme
VLWAALARDRTREMILATRFGFHGKKGLACAVTGSETDRERDPRVKFISFPMCECYDLSMRDDAFDPTHYRKELEAVWAQYGRRLTALITEPYLGGGGSYHPPKAYLRLLQDFCREHDLVFILDEVQANFGRTGDLFAFETYGLTPDAVVLGKGLGNGVPVAAVVGRSDLFNSLDYGDASDTWSANPLCCAAVLATLDGFAESDVLGNAHRASALIEAGLVRLKELPFIAAVRGEHRGMVWGIETRDFGGQSAAEWANRLVLAAYRGRSDGDGIHLLGALARKVVRVSPPLTITATEAHDSVELLVQAVASLAEPSHAALVEI